MKFTYNLTIWECMVCAMKKACRKLFYESTGFRMFMIIIGGAAILGSILASIADDEFHIGMILIIVCAMLLISIFLLLLRFPIEAVKIYRQYGGTKGAVWIEDGSLFVSSPNTVVKYPCRSIREFKKRGRMYCFVMLSCLNMPVEVFLPARVVGGAQEQDAFRRFVNDQRRISGDKLIAGETDEIADEEKCGICQRWTLETLAEALIENQWIVKNAMPRKAGKNWSLDNLSRLIAGTVVIGVAVVFVRSTGAWGFWSIVTYIGLIILRRRRIKKPVISQKVAAESLRRYGPELYEQSWHIQFTPLGIERKTMMAENTWTWEETGYLFETDDFYYFYTKKQQSMLYLEKSLMGDWMTQKLFVQDCQAKGIVYQLVYPQYEKDMPPESQNVVKQEESGYDFQAEKEEDKDKPGRSHGGVIVLAVIGILLLAVLFPNLRRGGDLGGTAVIMDMPEDNGEYVFHPEAYENYVPLADQVEVLKSLGFTIPEGIVEEMEQSMPDMPMSRAWVEGYPYADLLSAIGMPEWDWETGQIAKYPDQAYWFDWEGFDMSTEYVNILNGLNAMSGGDFTITDAAQDMSESDWEKGTGTVYIRFAIDGEAFKYKLKLAGDWLDTGIISDLNNALIRAGIKKRIYAMDDGGQGCILLYRDKAWADRFKKQTGIRLRTK